MLEKIIKLENVGLLASPLAKAIELKQATLVYADNGRGKSTLSAVLRACATGDADAMSARATIGSKGLPQAQLRFRLPAGGGTTVTFDKGAWDAAMPNVLVFDQAFVERNVYAGGSVDTEQHQALLDFAIGAQSVAKKRQVDAAADAQVAATKARTAADNKLQGYRGTMPLPLFLALGEEQDADAKIADFEKRIANANASVALNQRPQLKLLLTPELDLTGFAAVLASSFKQMQENAEALVKGHLETHGGNDAQRWIGDGQRFHVDGTCPFCGQATGGLDLISAYGTYFNEQYNQHVKRVASLPDLARSALSEATVASLRESMQGNSDRVQAWADQLTLACPPPDAKDLERWAQEIRVCLEEAVAKKVQQPLEPVPGEALDAASKAFDELVVALRAYNESLKSANEEIAAFKKKLDAEDVAQLQAGLTRVRLQKTRYSADVAALVKDYKDASSERETQEKAKAAARAELDQLMTATLDEYQTDINAWLNHLRTPFKIDKLKFSYQGGTTPRTEYGVVVRNQHVAAGRAAAKNAPSFSTVLSDGDKRSLALAFFLAKALHDKSHAENIVVLDDVFASLDSNRRAQTIVAMCAIATRCAQLVVLAHDAYFLLELQKALGKEGADILAMQIRRVGELSELVTADFSAMCESDYYRQYKTVYDYLNGPAPGNLLPVAQAIRPLVEGNLHRRFPGHIPEGLTVGQILGLIDSAPAGSTLAELQSESAKLHQFNNFAAAFHHNTEGKVVRTVVTDGELNPFAKAAMAFVHLGVLP